MCTVQLPPGDNPIAVNKYISYHIITMCSSGNFVAAATSALNFAPMYDGRADWHKS